MMATDQLFLFVFIGLWLLHFLIERGLAVLNARHVSRHRDRVPEIVRDTLPAAGYERSIDYALARTRFGHVEAFLGAALTALYLFSGLIPWLQQQSARLITGEILAGTVLVLSLILLHGVVILPAEWYETFHLEARFGFNRTTAKTFWLDKFKGLVLTLVIGIPVLYVILALLARLGSIGWLAAAGFVIGFQLVMMVLHPLLIAPWFNRFTRLEEGELRSAVVDLARRCAFTAREIFVMDGSTRSAHSNAYFTGIGRSRRIVLFDTLIQQLTVAELVAVLAHEIGHFKRRHILKLLGLSSILTLAGFWVMGRMIDWPPLYGAFHISQPSVSVGIVLLGLISGAFTFWLGPFFNALSRKYEYEADHDAVQHTLAPDAMESALRKLSVKNLSTLLPHPAYSAWHDSHPTLIERIASIRKIRS